jgi:hypothetical protein
LVSEKDYYRNIAVWLEKNGYYVGRTSKNRYCVNDLFVKRGKKKAQADVVGIKNIGKSLSDNIEVAIVEVKHSHREKPIKLRHIEQAAGYQVYGHKCYLAAVEPLRITEENKIDAVRKNVGILKVPSDFHRKKIKQIKIDDIETVCYPTRSDPNEADMLDFLDNLGIVKCTLCGCYFFTFGDYDDGFGLSPKRGSFRRLERNKTFALYPDRINDQFETKHKLHSKKSWKQICLPCMRDLSEALGLQKLEKRLSELERKMKSSVN